MLTIGIRREDKSRWERRVPLIPADLESLRRDQGLRFVVQPSPVRVFEDGAYRDAGADVRDDLSGADIVFAVKEVPADLILPGKVYVFFSHVIKGQPHSMPMLQRLMERGCTLVDYERIVDDRNRRLIFFSLHAGYAGMIETLWCLGRRLQWEGCSTPLVEVRHAYEYGTLHAAREHLAAIGSGLGPDAPASIPRLILGIAGYGNVARGAQEILGWLPVADLEPAELASSGTAAKGVPVLRCVVFREEDMAATRTAGGVFDLSDYYAHPERYRGRFEEHLPHLDVLVNAIYWDERYPRLVSRAWARDAFAEGARPRIRVVGDISCDVEGAVELTVRTTDPASPAFVYDPTSERVSAGVEGRGIVIMAVDNLPCELPEESSRHFSSALSPMVPALASADWGNDFAALDLPPSLRKAVIVHKGELTPEYRYLDEHLRGAQIEG